jgi:hypothetical protein
VQEIQTQTKQSKPEHKWQEIGGDEMNDSGSSLL